MSHGKQYSTEAIIDALESVHGAITLAADKLGCSYKTIERRSAEVKAVQDVIEKYSKRRVDIAELALDKGLANGEQWAVVFTLKTLGKNRGYTERTEITGAENTPIKILVEYSKDDTNEFTEPGSFD